MSFFPRPVTLPKRTNYGLWGRNSVFVPLMLASLSLCHLECFWGQVTDIELNCLDHEDRAWLTQWGVARAWPGLTESYVLGSNSLNSAFPYELTSSAGSYQEVLGLIAST